MKKLTKILALTLVCVCAVAVLCACGPASNPEKAVEALKGDGYSAHQDEQLIPGLLLVAGVKGIDSVVVGTKTADGKTDSVTVVYFTSSSAANEAWEKVQDFAEDRKEGDESDWTIAKSGKMIYWGTSAGIKAAR